MWGNTWFCLSWIYCLSVLLDILISGKMGLGWIMARGSGKSGPRRSDWELAHIPPPNCSNGCPDGRQLWPLGRLLPKHSSSHSDDHSRGKVYMSTLYLVQSFPLLQKPCIPHQMCPIGWALHEQPEAITGPIQRACLSRLPWVLVLCRKREKILTYFFFKQRIG